MDWTLLKSPNLSGLNSCDGWDGCSTASRRHRTRTGAATWSRRANGPIEPSNETLGEYRRSTATHWHQHGRQPPLTHNPLAQNDPGNETLGQSCATHLHHLRRIPPLTCNPLAPNEPGNETLGHGHATRLHRRIPPATCKRLHQMKLEMKQVTNTANHAHSLAPHVALPIPLATGPVCPNGPT
jgi:hypothetical protein